jgi:cell division protein ZapA
MEVSAMTKTIEVEIYGQRYVVTGATDEEYVKRCANYVDTQIRVLAQGMKTATRAKLAVLAALNITHQLFQAERARQEGDAEVDRRAMSLMESIEEQLEPARKK